MLNVNAAFVITVILSVLVDGCFSERSFTVPEDRLVTWVQPTPPAAPAAETLDARAWADVAAALFQPRLPPQGGGRVVLTAAMVRDPLYPGYAVNVYRRYHRNGRWLDTLPGNPTGLQQTAQVSPAGDERAPAGESWAGFEEVTIPMSDGLKLCARIAEPLGRDGDDSYVVETHGLFCGQEGYEARNMSDALRRYGHHVVAIEMRGHGQTEKLNRDRPMTFGASEVRDLIEVARWLRAERGAKRVGLLSFSITAQQALAAAWVDGGAAAAEVAAGSGSPILAGMPAPTDHPAYDAIIAVAPPLNLVAYADSLERPYNMLESPVRATFQYRIAQRLAAQGERPAHSMWQFARHELGRSEWADRYADGDAMIADLTAFIDFSGDRWTAGARRLSAVRCPVLIVASANDPLGSAQATADLVARVDNPNVGLLLVGGGGHTGLSAMSAAYYHSLVRAFFDPRTGPTPAGDAGRARPAPDLTGRQVAGVD